MSVLRKIMYPLISFNIMQLTGGRGRSFSTTASPRAEAEPPAAAAPAPPPPARATAAVKRKKSVPTRQDKSVTITMFNLNP